jgi:hypothetical protein
MAEPGALETGWRKFQLIRLLAEGEITRAKMAKQYGVSSRAITDFARRHAVDIAEAKRFIQDELAALWVSKKANRVAEYQQMIDDLGAELDCKLRPGGEYVPPEERIGLRDRDLRDVIKTRATLLRDVAEQLGQLPQRSNDTNDSVSLIHQLVGVPDEDL